MILYDSYDTVLLRNINRTQNAFETRSTRVPAPVGAQARRPLHEVRTRSGCVPAPVEPRSFRPEGATGCNRAVVFLRV